MGLAFALTSCGNGGGFPDAVRSQPVASGTFSLQWQIHDGSGQLETCAQAGATSMQVAIANHATREQYSEMFVCDSGVGLSGQLFTGTYDLRSTLVGPAGAIVSTASPSVIITSDAAATVPTLLFVVP